MGTEERDRDWSLVTFLSHHFLQSCGTHTANLSSYTSSQTLTDICRSLVNCDVVEVDGFPSPNVTLFSL